MSHPTVPTTPPGPTPPGGAPNLLATPIQQAFHRATTTPDYFRWLDHITSAAGCSHPIRLAGQIHTVDPATGAIIATRDTRDMPDGVIYKNCGNRRATACPSCSATYRRDAYQLIRAGLVGGKGIPATVAAHPTVFATLTAPSFGPVHTQRTNSSGQHLRCRPRRTPNICPHGRDLRCHRIHDPGEKILGQPLCLDCYDHNHQVVWNHSAGELWRRTRIGIDRRLKHLAKARGIDPKTIRVSYGKVAEMQRRGVVHFHAILRLDGTDPDNPDAITPAPDGISLADLVDAIQHAATHTAYQSPPHHRHPHGWPIAWGDQLDIRPIHNPGDSSITDEKVAGYLAKYATKSTETTGHLSRRLDYDTITTYANPNGNHIERLIHACWQLGGYDPNLRLTDQHQRPYGRLRRWAHMLGFGGHFLTKSRRYTTTFRILRDNRVIWRRTQTHEPTHQNDQDTVLLVANLHYAGAGWHTLGDALLANTAAALARDRQRIGRLEAQTSPRHVRVNRHERKDTMDTQALLDQIARGAVVAVIPNPRPSQPDGVADRPAPAKRWYSMQEVADMLGYGLAKVKMLVITREIRSVKDGKYRRILPEWVDEYVRRRVEESSQ